MTLLSLNHGPMMLNLKSSQQKHYSQIRHIIHVIDGHNGNNRFYDYLVITAAEKENNRYIYFEEHTLNGGLPLREKGYTMKGGGE